MIIEIGGIGFRNIGAELMLIAAQRELSTWTEVDRLVVNFLAGTPNDRRRVGVKGVARIDSVRLRRVANYWRVAVEHVPPFALMRVGLVPPSQVDALVDASGFAFGDQLGPIAAQSRSRLYRSFVKRGARVVLLPQAFGPFDRTDVSKAASAGLDMCDLIVARDGRSLEHLTRLRLSRPQLLVAPDFTNLIDIEAPSSVPDLVVLIPNTRMVSMPGSPGRTQYMGFLTAAASEAAHHGFRVVVIAHDDADRRLATEIRSDQKLSVTVAPKSTALEIRRLIGSAALVISSRYHGLVSALSQGVPAIGTSWSHKYPDLFEAYRCPEALWDVGSPEATKRRVSAWLDPHVLSDRRKALEGPAEDMRQDVRRMWLEVRRAVAPQS